MGAQEMQPDPERENAANSAAPRGIVVGVDGSDHGQCALVWAAREAERRRRPLHIVTAYSVPIFAASGLDGGYATVDDSVIREGAELIDSVWNRREIGPEHFRPRPAHPGLPA